MLLKWILAPAVGGIIGYITNDIAVRMLFRPHEPKYLFGRKLPFTPGLIPKERERLSGAVRGVLDEELLNRETIEGALLSDSMLQKIDEAAGRAMEEIFAMETTPHELLLRQIKPDKLENVKTQVLGEARDYLMDKLLHGGVETTIAQAVIEQVRQRLNESSAGILTLFWDEKRSVSLEKKLSALVLEQMEQRGPEMLDNLLNSSADQFLDTPIKTLLERFSEKRDEARGLVRNAYIALVKAVLPKALSALDLGALVEQKLNALNMKELEELILRVMKKELRAIVWLGALLGTLMGIVNVFL